MSGPKRGWVCDRAETIQEQQKEFDGNFSYPVAGSMCSGSRQPTETELAQIVQHIKNNKKADLVIIIDLRDEAHLFCDYGPIGWDDVDEEKHPTRDSEFNREVEIDSARRLEENKELLLFTKHKQADAPKVINARLVKTRVVKTEEEVVLGLDAIYQRFPVTDHGVPNSELVDQFIMFVHNLPANAWLHFHCHGGKGRTSTFIAMYNLLYFAKHPGAMPENYDAMDNPKLKTKEDRRTSDEQLNRIAFMKSFKLYVNAYAAALRDEKEPPLWSEWQKQRSITKLFALQQSEHQEVAKMASGIMPFI